MKQLTTYTLLLLLLLTASVASCDKVLSVSIDDKVPPSFTFDASRFAECCNYLQYFAVMEETSEDTRPMFNSDPSINHKILWKIEHKDSSKGKIQNLPVITYGKVPDGWQQTIPNGEEPSPLTEGRIYEAGEPARTQTSVVRFTIRNGKTERLN